MPAKRLLLAAVLAFRVALSAASPPAAPARAEIDTLLARLEASGCEFERNGSWHSGASARAHLLRKLDYLEGKGPIPSAERFVELAASASSSSGRPYRVRCGGGSPVESRRWLTGQLGDIRRLAERSKP